ncbi:hypothetical protein C8Q76DRAFT_691503 [Earliella scabrosa]|nr:hypothetical protein C8Q76DRAFT_691503 [Earliella scabrosa]
MSNAARVYLGGIPDSITTDEIFKNHCQYLSIYGRIQEIKLRPGFGFVQFYSEKARCGPDFLQSGVLRSCSSPLDLNKRRYPVVVKGLNPRTCWQELKDFGRLLGGNVAYCDIDRHSHTEGFINYTLEEDAARAVLELNGRELLGNKLQLSRHDQERPNHSDFHPSKSEHLQSHHDFPGRDCQAIPDGLAPKMSALQTEVVKLEASKGDIQLSSASSITCDETGFMEIPGLSNVGDSSVPALPTLPKKPGYLCSPNEASGHASQPPGTRIGVHHASPTRHRDRSRSPIRIPYRRDSPMRSPEQQRYARHRRRDYDYNYDYDAGLRPGWDQYGGYYDDYYGYHERPESFHRPAMHPPPRFPDCGHGAGFRPSL